MRKLYILVKLQVIAEAAEIYSERLRQPVSKKNPIHSLRRISVANNKANACTYHLDSTKAIAIRIPCNVSAHAGLHRECYKSHFRHIHRQSQSNSRIFY